jgi:hypothetical protein
MSSQSKPWLCRPTHALVAIVLAGAIVIPCLSAGSVPDATGSVTTGPELDYQSSVVRVDPTGRLLLVFERIDAASFYGDLWVTWSDDEGHSWATPQAIVDSALNERHPALVQLAPDSFALFYLVDETGGGSYRIHRAISSDGAGWTEMGAVDLGWASFGEINPAVVHEGSDVLTMTYQRSGAYIARSLDGGATWDLLQTPVSSGWAALPRVAFRPSDGAYLVTYQINPSGNNDLDVVAKTSKNPYDWSGPEVPISDDVNSHDSRPMVLPGGGFAVVFARQTVSAFDVHYRTSCDGVVWDQRVQVTDDPSRYDTQPHLLAHLDPGRAILTWSHQVSADPYVDHDVLIETDLEILGCVFCDGFESSDTSTWGDAVPERRACQDPWNLRSVMNDSR